MLMVRKMLDVAKINFTILSRREAAVGNWLIITHADISAEVKWYSGAVETLSNSSLSLSLPYPPFLFQLFSILSLQPYSFLFFTKKTHKHDDHKINIGSRIAKLKKGRRRIQLQREIA
jgi:hypothetical protein